MPDPTTPSSEQLDAAASTRRKTAWRILPLLFCLYVIAYIDRANVGFAKLRMLDDLQFSEAVYGWGVALFFIGYMFLEIPGALLVERCKAKKEYDKLLAEKTGKGYVEKPRP